MLTILKLIYVNLTFVVLLTLVDMT